MGHCSWSTSPGSLILGWVVVAKAQWRPLVGTGFCGALTTFSTFQVQMVELGDDGHVALAAAYLAVSVAGRPRRRGGGSEAGAPMIAWVAMTLAGSLGAYLRWQAARAARPARDARSST